MKKFIIQCIISTISLIVIPLSVCAFDTDKIISEELHINNTSDIGSPYTDEKEKNTSADGNTIKVFNADTDTVMELSFREYITGVVAGEMPVEFHSEALSACTVAAATLARKKLESGSDAQLDGAVISTDPAKHQAYMSVEEMKEKWQDDFDAYYKKLTEAVDKAIDYSVTYNGELIIAAYHSISPGKTESAENIWSAAYPYLISVESEGDKLSPKYESVVELSKEDFRKKMKDAEVIFDDNEISISAGEYTDAGTLKKITIGNKDFTGKELREIFGLRSAAITITKTDNNIVFNVKGYGHGVGMSQYGADYYARQGMTWQEIISHYYPNTQIIIYRSSDQ